MSSVAIVWSIPELRRYILEHVYKMTHKHKMKYIKRIYPEWRFCDVFNSIMNDTIFTKHYFIHRRPMWTIYRDKKINNTQYDSVIVSYVYLNSPSRIKYDLNG